MLPPLHSMCWQWLGAARVLPCVPANPAAMHSCSDSKSGPRLPIGTGCRENSSPPVVQEGAEQRRKQGRRSPFHPSSRPDSRQASPGEARSSLSPVRQGG